MPKIVELVQDGKYEALKEVLEEKLIKKVYEKIEEKKQDFIKSIKANKVSSEA